MLATLCSKPAATNSEIENMIEKTPSVTSDPHPTTRLFVPIWMRL
jgi:hypothetical protein